MALFHPPSVDIDDGQLARMHDVALGKVPRIDASVTAEPPTQHSNVNVNVNVSNPQRYHPVLFGIILVIVVAMVTSIVTQPRAFDGVVRAPSTGSSIAIVADAAAAPTMMMRIANVLRMRLAGS